MKKKNGVVDSTFLWTTGPSPGQDVLQHGRTHCSNAEQHTQHAELDLLGSWSQQERESSRRHGPGQPVYNDRPTEDREGPAQVLGSALRDIPTGRSSHRDYRQFGRRDGAKILITAPHAREYIDDEPACNPHSQDLMALPSAVALSRTLSKMCKEGCCAGSFKVFLGDVNRCHVDINRNPKEAKPYIASMHHNIFKQVTKPVPPKLIMDMHSYPPKMQPPYHMWGGYDLSIMVYDENKPLAERLKGYLLHKDPSRKIQVVDAHPISYIQRMSRDNGVPCLLLEHNEGSFYNNSLTQLNHEKVSKFAWDTASFVQGLCTEWAVAEDSPQDLGDSLKTHEEYLRKLPFII